jgi:hypothetical protein
MRECEPGKPIAEACFDVGELEIGDHLLCLASCKIQPDAHCALPAGDFGWQREPFAPRFHVRIIEPDVDLTARLLPFL